MGASRERRELANGAGAGTRCQESRAAATGSFTTSSLDETSPSLSSTAPALSAAFCLLAHSLNQVSPICAAAFL